MKMKKSLVPWKNMQYYSCDNNFCRFSFKYLVSCLDALKSKPCVYKKFYSYWPKTFPFYRYLDENYYMFRENIQVGLSELKVLKGTCLTLWLLN